STRTRDASGRRRPGWYCSRTNADPNAQETPHGPQVRLHRSKDRGKTWANIATPHSDNHDLCSDPNDPLRMIEANDGGACVSTDGGATWTTLLNQPTAQFYRLSVDNDFPYRILGPQQDNSAVRIRHRTNGSSIGQRDCEPTAGGETGYIVAGTTNTDI